jgi:hypothetical protein
MREKTTLALAARMNEIEREIYNLEFEYNKIIEELKRRMPQLENDVNLQKKKVKVNKNAENGKKVQ